MVLRVVLVATVGWSTGCSLEYLMEGTASSSSGASGGGGGGASDGGAAGAPAGGAAGEGGGGPSNDVWAFAYGSPEEQQEGVSVAIDRSCSGGGCPVMVGFFADSVNLGGQELFATPNDSVDVDVFVAKFDEHGGHLWSKDFGDERDQRPESVAVDSAGNAIVVGWFKGEIDFSGALFPFAAKPSYRNDAFVAKFGPTGDHVWSFAYGGKSDGSDDQHQQARAVAVDSMDNIVVAGSFTGSITFDGVQHNATDAQDVFLVKLTPDGARIWSEAWDGMGNSQNAPTIAVDASDDVYLGGNFTSVLPFDAPCAMLSAGDDEDAFIAKLDGATGACLWAKQFGDESGGQLVRAIAPLPDGDVVVAFELAGAIDFGDGELTGNSRDVVVARLSGVGEEGAAWVVRAVDAKEQYVVDAAADADGSVVLAGSFLESLTMDPESPAWSVASNGESDVFLLRLDPEGKLAWAQGFGRYANDHGRSVAVDAEGHAVLTGAFRGIIDFGKTELPANQRKQDIFLAKFRPEAPAP